MAYGKRKGDPEDSNREYKRLTAALRNDTVEKVYVFFGVERFLLEEAVRSLRARIPKGTEEFNDHRLDGRTMTMDDLSEAVDAIPVFSERSLVEVSGLDLSKLSEDVRRELVRILRDVPDGTTVVFILDGEEFKLDGRVKVNQELKGLVTAVEFVPQDQDFLIRKLVKRFGAVGKKIDRDAAVELISRTGSSMTRMIAECGKLESYITGDTVRAQDVRDVVMPVLDAAAYELTDALLSGKGDTAIRKLGEFIQMDEPAQRMIFSISQKFRQLLTAKVCQLTGRSMRDFKELAEIRFDFQAKSLWDLAQRQTLERCAGLMEMCAETAYKLNSSPQDEEELMEELAVRILSLTGARR